MVRVALLQPNVNVPTGANDVYQRPGQVSTADAEMLGGAAQAAQQVGNTVDTVKAAQIWQQKQDAAAWTANTMSSATLTWQQKLQDSKLNAPAGAPDFTKNTLSDFDTWKTDQLANAPDDISRKYLDTKLTALRTEIGTQANVYEGQQKVKWREDQFTSAADNAANAAFNDPTKADQLINDIASPLHAMQMPGDWKAEQLKKATDKIRLAAAVSVAQSNPAAIVGQPGSAATAAGGGQSLGGFQGADAFVAQKEGGFVANDNNRGATNFGINSTANPDIDVSKLTPEQATQVRKSRYWDAIHGDALPPSLQPVAYNFAIQAGAGTANRLIQQSGGDPAKFNDLAKAYYDAIPADRANGNTQAWKDRSDEALALGKTAAPSGDNPLLSSLPYQSRIQVFNMAKTQQNQDMSMWRARIDGRLQDVQAMATQGISDPTPLTLDTLLKAYPPDEAAQRYTAYRDSQQLAVDVSNVKGMPNDQIAGLVTARAPVAGPGFAQAQHDQAILQQAAAHVIEQRNTDPAAYVSQNSVAVQMAQKAFVAAQTPQTAQAYAQASIAEQTRLGIAKPQILTKAQTTALEDQFKANNGANADQVIQQQAQLWGPQWGTVFGQLKDIPPVAKVLGYLGDSVDASTRQQILQASQVKIDALKDGLVAANVTAGKAALDSKVQPFASTLAYSVGGPQTFSALYDSAERLMYTYMRQGQNANDAASNAFASVMGKNFNVVGTARIPSQFDSDTVMQGAKTLLDGIDKQDLMLPPAPKTMRDSDVKSQYVSNIRSNAKWVTSSDGKGLVLFDPVSQTVVRTKDGQPVGAKFSDLTAKKSANVPAPSLTQNPFTSAGAPNVATPGIDNSPGMF